jgi:TRAP-type mannitol/chloroaromatic compound transport system permease small subunit/energy-converting hydrogenase Eha subunit C
MTAPVACKAYACALPAASFAKHVITSETIETGRSQTMADVTQTPDSLSDTGGSMMKTATRMFAWTMVAMALVYVGNVYLTYWQEWPGVLALVGGSSDSIFAWLQLASYVACIMGAAAYVLRSPSQTLRADADILNGFVTFIIRAAFWIVLLVGFADAIISFLRVEGLLEPLFGDAIASDLGRSSWRGPYVHMPLLVLAIVIAAVTRGLGFIWLGLLVVIAELLIVISRFIFSYEQAFQGDLVRFWYAALFLFASAYTLHQEGHVRVDVFYAGFARPTQGRVNYFGAIVMGILFCWVILALGTWSQAAVIVSPFLSFEVSQSGFGMYVKYLMASFLGVFAVSMLVQFAAYMMEALADVRGDPGGREPPAPGGH